MSGLKSFFEHHQDAYKAIATDGHTWVYGFPSLPTDGSDLENAKIRYFYYYTHEGQMALTTVYADTICRFTGIFTVDNKPLFEGDIVTCETVAYRFKDFVIKWLNQQCRFIITKENERYAMSDSFKYWSYASTHDNKHKFKFINEKGVY